MSLLFHLMFFYVHLLTVIKHVQSAPVLSAHHLHVKQLFDNGTLSVDCKDAISVNIFSKAPQDWCQGFNLYKDFMIVHNECNQTEYEILSQAACSKEEFVMTEGTIINTPKILTSTRLTTLSTKFLPTTHISTPPSTHRISTPTSMPKTTHTATTMPTTHMSAPKSTLTATAPTMPTSVPTTTTKKNVNTSPKFQKGQMNSVPYAESTGTEKLLLTEQTETASSSLTTRRQATYHGMLPSDTSTNKINTSSTITAEDFVFKTTESDPRLEVNLEDLLQQVTAYRNYTARIEVCQTEAMAKLTRESDLDKVCATVKQLKEMLDEKCVKTDYDRLIVETLQLFDCLVCRT